MQAVSSVSGSSPANIGPSLAQQKAQAAVWFGPALANAQSQLMGTEKDQSGFLLQLGAMDLAPVRGSAAVICGGVTKYGIGVNATTAAHGVPASYASDEALAKQLAQQLELLLCPVTAAVG